MIKSENEYSIVIATFADKELAKTAAKMLVEKRLAACVQILPIESIYMWKDEVCDDNEIMLFIKSRADMFEKIKVAIKEIHPYEVPEIIMIPIVDGLGEYLKWIDDCVLWENEGTGDSPFWDKKIQKNTFMLALGQKIDFPVILW